MPTDLIAGSATTLAPGLAARLLRDGREVVVVTGPEGVTPERLRHEVRLAAPDAEEGRLRCVVVDPDIGDVPPVAADRLWWLDAAATPRQARRGARLLALLDRDWPHPPRRIEHVIAHPRSEGEDPVGQLARRHGSSVRRIRVPAMLGTNVPAAAPLTGVSAALSLLLTVGARLRRSGAAPDGPWPVPPATGASVPLVPPEAAAERIAALAADGADDAEVPPEIVVPAERLWAALARVAGARVDDTAPEPLASLVAARLDAPDVPLRPAAGTPGAPPHPAAEKLARVAALTLQESGRAQRAAALRAAAALRPVELPRPDGGLLTVFRADAGLPAACDRPAVVVVNALGQGLDVWFPLLARLLPRHPVVVWRPRAERPGGVVVDFGAQVADTLAVLDLPGLERCHLVGWCTGAKTAFEVHRARPARVLSVVSLNGSFKTSPEPEDDDVPYERNLASLARTLERRPELAERLSAVFTPAAAGEGEGDLGRGLVQPGPAVRRALAAPFADVGRLRTYCAQMMDFWRQPAWTAVPQLPVLALGAQHDEVVSTTRARAVLSALPDVRDTEIAGAGHQSLYDDAELVAAHIEEFVVSRD